MRGWSRLGAAIAAIGAVVAKTESRTTSPSASAPISAANFAVPGACAAAPVPTMQAAAPRRSGRAPGDPPVRENLISRQVLHKIEEHSTIRNRASRQEESHGPHALLLALLVRRLALCRVLPDRTYLLANFPRGRHIVTRVVAEGGGQKFPHGITGRNKPGAKKPGVSDLILQSTMAIRFCSRRSRRLSSRRR
jgi:hypothetical protein